MGNIKKLISIVICFTLIMTFPFAVAEAGSASDGVLLTQYRGLFSALDMEQLPAGVPVTRGQFVTNLIGLMDFGTYGSGKQTFTDVTAQNESLYSAVEHAVGIGAVSAAEKFYPDRAVTYAQACKMTVEALGYGQDAQYRGGYPAGYFAVASSLDLDDGIDVNSEFTSDTMYILLGNAANTNVKVMTSCKSDGEFFSYTLESTEPLLQAYRDISKVEGVITASDSGYLYDSTQTVDTGKIMINDVEYAVEKGVVCPLGFYANAYAEKRGNRQVIIYADVSDNNVTKISSSQVVDYDTSELKYYNANDREQRLKLTGDTVVLYNGKALEDYTKSDILISDGYIEAVDNDSNGSVDILCVWDAKYLLVDYVNVYSDEYDYVFYDKNRKNNIFIDSETNYRCNVDLSSISKENVLEAFVSKDGKFVKINLLSEKVSGSVDEVGSFGEIYIGGKEYETTSYFDEFYGLFAAPGKTVSFATDSFGKAVAVITAGGKSMKTAYFDNMADTANVLDDSVKVKLFTEDGEVIISTLADKVTVNSATKKAGEWIGLLNSVKGELIKFQQNDDGKICKINTESEDEGIYDALSDGADTLKRFRFPGDDADTTVYYKIFGYIVPHFTLNSSTKIFKINTGESDDEERFALGSLSFLRNDEKIPGNSIRPYNVTVSGVAGAVLYKTSDAASTNLSITSASAIVADCSLALDNAGNDVFKIKLYASDKFYVYYIKKDAKFLKGLTLNEEGYPFNVGDLIRYAVDDKGEYLLTAIKDFDYATETLLYNADDNTELHYYFGQIYAEGDGSVAIRKADGSIIYVPAVIGDVGIVEDGKVLTQPREKVTTYIQMGEECHKILIRCRYSSAGQIYVFK